MLEILYQEKYIYFHGNKFLSAVMQDAYSSVWFWVNIKKTEPQYNNDNAIVRIKNILGINIITRCYYFEEHADDFLIESSGSISWVDRAENR